MKTLLLLALVYSPFAHAATLSYDIDFDGKPDTMTLTGNDAHSQILEVRLSKSGKTLRFVHIAKAVATKTMDGAACREAATLERSGAWTFAINAPKAGECASDNDRVVFSYTDAGLGVDSVTRSFWSWSGKADPQASSYATAEITFTNSSLHVHNEAYPNVGDKTELLEDGCTLSASALEMNGVPSCATMPAFYLQKEIQYGSTAFCLDIERSYTCKQIAGDRPLTLDKLFVITRSTAEGSTAYDIDKLRATMIVDGKQHLVSESAGDTSSWSEYSQASCRRNVLQANSIQWWKLSDATDPRKPIHDRFPSYTQESTITQLDTKGDLIRIRQVNKILDDKANDGSYIPTVVFTVECTRVD